MTTITSDYSGDFTGVFHGIFEKNQVHHGVCVIVVSEGLLKFICQSCLTWEPIIRLIIKRDDKVSEDERIRVCFLVELAKIGSGELFLGQIICEFLKLLEMFWTNKTITINTLTLVSP